jgi:Tol biopolymer transport system component
MKARRFGFRVGALLALTYSLVGWAWASQIQPVTVLSPLLTAPSGGNGDSVAPILSGDGRYVVFASSANNLPTNASNYLPLMPAQMNVFLRDRASQSTILVSVNATGTGGGSDDSIPRGISTNGQFVLFESASSDLVAGVTNQVNNVFVRDVVNGVTILVSTGLNGTAASGASRHAVMTPDGRYVAFSSDATNLVADDTNGIADVFVRDLQQGITVLASLGATSNSLAVGGGSSDLPVLSSDGRYLAFYSTGTNLVSGVETVGEIYVRDLLLGETTAVSPAAHALVQSLLGTSNIFSCSPAISTNGQIIAYEACQTTGFGLPAAAPGVILSYDLQDASTTVVDTNAMATTFGSELNFRGFDMTPDGQFIAAVVGLPDAPGPGSAVEVWSAQTGLLTPASVSANNTMLTNGISDLPVMDASGRFTAFMSDATNLTANIVSNGFHLYLRDLLSGTTTLVDADTNGIGSSRNLGGFCSMSADGSVVAFAAYDGALVANDNNKAYDVFAFNATSNAIELVSARQSALPAEAADGPSALANMSVSTNGLVAFASLADNLGFGDANGCSQVFVRDLGGETTTLVSVDTNNLLPGNGGSIAASISADGRYVLFTSFASNLVAGDNNNATDVFVRDLQLETNVLVSVNTNETGSGNGASSAPIMSSDGRYVLFLSLANNLAAGSFSSTTPSLFWRDLQAGITRVVATRVGIADPVMTPDGQNVAWCSSGSLGPTVPLFIWNAQTDGNTYTNSQLDVGRFIAISPDGTRIAGYSSQYNGPLWVVDRVAQTNFTLPGPGTSPARPGLQFSSDGRYLVYSSYDGANKDQIYVYDFQTATNLLVSASFSAQGAGNNYSDSPTISPDGRFIAYRSFASNLTPSAYNSAANVFLYDQVSGATMLASVSQFDNASANGPSATPVFSADSQTLVFQSWASDLLSGFFSSSGEVWALSLYSSNSPPAFSTAVGPAFISGQGPTLTWEVAPGHYYQAQYKNELNDPVWQAVIPGVIIVGNQGYFSDPSPSSSQRFYRIVAF